MSNQNLDESVLLQKLLQLDISLDDTLSQQLLRDYDRILSVGEECISATELSDLLIRQGRGSVARKATKEAGQTDGITDPQAAVGFNLYDGFEPSGRMHIAQGIFKARNVNKCTYHQNGGTFIFWIADWFALMKYVVSCCVCRRNEI
jgi:tRNA synthetases class I (W and Y)